MSNERYSVETAGEFDEQCNRLDARMYQRLENAIEKISELPFIGKKLREKRFRGCYSYRVGRYRLIYSIDVKNKTCYLMAEKPSFWFTFAKLLGKLT